MITTWLIIEYISGANTILKLNSNSRIKFKKKLIFNQYLEIRERLQPKFANFLISKYRQGG